MIRAKLRLIAFQSDVHAGEVDTAVMTFHDMDGLMRAVVRFAARNCRQRMDRNVQSIWMDGTDDGDVFHPPSLASGLGPDTHLIIKEVIIR